MGDEIDPTGLLAQTMTMAKQYPVISYEGVDMEELDAGRCP